MQVFKLLTGYNLKLIKMKDKVVQTLKADDVLKAKKEGKLAVALALDVWHPSLATDSEYLDEDLELLWLLHKAGLRQMHPLYYARNTVGDGFAEAQYRRDGGLSIYGQKVMNRMNELGILIDMAHASPLTILDTCEVTKQPVIYSHGAVRKFKDFPRSINDEGLKAIAETGGVTCLIDTHKFLGDPEKRRTVDDYMNHIEYAVNLVGADHVGLGLDRSNWAGEFANTRGILMPMKQYMQELATILPELDKYESEDTKGHVTGDWNYLPITAGLMARGFSEQEILKILGENLLRVYRKVWK